VKSAGKSFGMQIVWYAALPAQAARVRAADENGIQGDHEKYDRALLPILWMLQG